MDVLPESLVGVPLASKWDVLKPYLEHFYIEQGESIKEIVETVRREYSFDA